MTEQLRARIRPRKAESRQRSIRLDQKLAEGLLLGIRGSFEMACKDKGAYYVVRPLSCYKINEF